MFKLSFKNFLLARIAHFRKAGFGPVSNTFYKVCKTQGSGLYSLCKFRCAKFGTEGVQNSESISMEKSITFAGATTVCAKLRGVQITGVCKLRGFTVLIITSVYRL